ncbi:MAG: hypothetical protein Q7T40_10705 [Methylobacter sp.]|nr:hypothetical protein [Methylobacter sp.]
MKIASLKKAFITALISISAGHAGIALAHSGGGIIDPGSNNASATDLAAVTCGPGTHHLSAQVKDISGPVPGLLLSLHLYKGNQMTTSTDAISGDANYSPPISLNAGQGVYYMSLTKTNIGGRQFDVIWHCMAGDDATHTETDISVVQFQ